MNTQKNMQSQPNTNLRLEQAVIAELHDPRIEKSRDSRLVGESGSDIRCGGPVTAGYVQRQPDRFCLPGGTFADGLRNSCRYADRRE